LSIVLSLGPVLRDYTGRGFVLFAVGVIYFPTVNLSIGSAGCQAFLVPIFPTVNNFKVKKIPPAFLQVEKEGFTDS